MTSQEHQAFEPTTAGTTRATILNAAGLLVAETGSPGSLGATARRAQVTKGGLLYHFPSKDLLLTALMRERLHDFRRAVHQTIQEDDTDAGQLMRAYIRASFIGATTHDRALNPKAITTHLLVLPTLRDLAVAEATLWREELITDGLPPDLVSLITSTTDGLYGPSRYALDDSALSTLRESLIGMTRCTARPAST